MIVIKILSLFDGISCGMVALERAGIKVDEYYASEIDKYAIKVSEKNYPNIKRIGDVTKVKGADLPKIDLLIGGSPCQGFSFAGKQLNFNDERSKLFFEYVRLLEETKPKYFLLENVKMKKEYQDVISKYLGVEPIEINSALVSAQNRKRLYWTNIPNVTQPEDKKIFLKDVLESGVPAIVSNQGKCANKINIDKSYCLLARDYKGFGNQAMTGVAEPIRLGQIGKGGQGQRIYSVTGKSVTLSANGGGQGAKTGLYKLDLPDGDYIIRKLTPIEAERLQTLPDDYTNHVSSTQRYKGIGNGWTVDVIAHIFKNMEV